MLYLVHGLSRMRLKYPLKRVVYNHLESPGTKAYTLREANDMLRKIGYSKVRVHSQLSAGDLLKIKPSERYSSPLLRLLYLAYPRWLVRLLGGRLGLNLFIQASK